MIEENLNITQLTSFFEKTLGVDVNLKENKEMTEEGVFHFLVDSLEKCASNQEKLAIEWGIDISYVLIPFWNIIDFSISNIYSRHIYDLIYWYIYSRIGKEGEILPYEFQEKEYYFKTSKDLWSFVKNQGLLNYEDDSL